MWKLIFQLLYLLVFRFFFSNLNLNNSCFENKKYEKKLLGLMESFYLIKDNNPEVRQLFVVHNWNLIIKNKTWQIIIFLLPFYLSIHGAYLNWKISHLFIFLEWLIEGEGWGADVNTGFITFFVKFIGNRKQIKGNSLCKLFKKIIIKNVYVSPVLWLKCVFVGTD